MNKLITICIFAFTVLLYSCTDFQKHKLENTDELRTISAFNKDDFEQKVLESNFFFDSISSSVQYDVFLSYLYSCVNIKKDDEISEKIYDMFHNFSHKQIEILQQCDKFSCRDTLKANLYACLNNELWKREYKDSISIFLEPFIIRDTSILSEITKTILPYLFKHSVDRNKIVVVINFKEKGEEDLWVGFDIVNKDRLRLEGLKGYFNKDKYTFIISGDETAFSFIGRNVDNLLELNFYNNPPITDGVVSWLYRMKRGKMRLISFNERW